MNSLQMYSIWLTTGLVFLAYGLKDCGTESPVRKLFRARPYLSSVLLIGAAHFFPVFLIMRLNNRHK